MLKEGADRRIRRDWGPDDLGDPDVGEGLPGEVEVSLDVLADDGLLVVAADVVPFDAVAVEIVEDRHARLASLAVVRLPLPRSAM